jgi:xanthine phosphoribosyltransferase
MAPTLYHLSWEELHRDTRALAHQLLTQQLPGESWRGVIGIARGGLVPAAILARELDLRLVDSLCIASYEHDQQGDAKILKAVEGDGEGFLLVDDLVDSGTTARIARKLLPKAVFVAIYAKPKGRELAQYYQREFSQETWIHFPWDVDLSYSEPLASRTK